MNLSQVERKRDMARPTRRVKDVAGTCCLVLLLASPWTLLSKIGTRLELGTIEQRKKYRYKQDVGNQFVSSLLCLLQDGPHPSVSCLLVGWLVGCLVQMTIDTVKEKEGIKETPRFCFGFFCPAVLFPSFLYLSFCNTSSSFVSNRNQKL